MLGKLYKHEFKYTAMQMIPILIAVTIAAFVNRFVMFYEYNANMNAPYSSAPFVFKMFQALSVILITAFIMVTLVLLIKRFTKTMVEDQGYLTLTLPVKSWEHILVKSSVSTFWILVSAFVTFAAFLLMIPEKGFFSEFIFRVSQGLRDIAGEFNIGVGSLILEIALYLVVYSITFFLTLYAAIAIGQLWNGRSKIGTFLAIVGFYIVNSILSNFITRSFLQSYEYSPSLVGSFFFGGSIDAQSNTFFLVYLLYLAVAGAVMFFVSSYIFEKKINLQ